MVARRVGQSLMATTARARRPGRSGGRTIPIQSGPWLGVNDATDPFENSDRYLYDAVNCYMPDPQRGSGTYQRPGWKCQNAGAPLIGSNRQGQCVYEHVELDGTLRRFLVVGGKMWRWNGDIGAPTFTDVTPVGVTIATSILFC